MFEVLAFLWWLVKWPIIIMGIFLSILVVCAFISIWFDEFSKWVNEGPERDRLKKNKLLHIDKVSIEYEKKFVSDVDGKLSVSSEPVCMMFYHDEKGHHELSITKQAFDDLAESVKNYSNFTELVHSDPKSNKQTIDIKLDISRNNLHFYISKQIEERLDNLSKPVGPENVRFGARDITKEDCSLTMGSNVDFDKTAEEIKMMKMLLDKPKPPEPPKSRIVKH